jgi:hypothetical protein
LALACALINSASAFSGWARPAPPSVAAARRWFTGIMALLMALTALYLLYDELQLAGVL